MRAKRVKNLKTYVEILEKKRSLGGKVVKNEVIVKICVKRGHYAGRWYRPTYGSASLVRRLDLANCALVEKPRYPIGRLLIITGWGIGQKNSKKEKKMFFVRLFACLLGCMFFAFCLLFLLFFKEFYLLVSMAKGDVSP